MRQPIVSVLGHVDHGKTSILDRIRGTSVVSREAGAITQHIGATEVPLYAIYDICGPLIKDKNFTIPGLLFIDTPGHHSFASLRSRGGALADLAVLVIDITEGFKPQTIESINVLKRHKTPFVIAANKVDRIDGWIPYKGEPFLSTLKKQNTRVQNRLDELLYRLTGLFYEKGFSADRYDRVSDFRKNLAIVPVSAKTGEGIPDLMLILVGLAQRFLEERLESNDDAPGEGTVLEVKDEKGMGPTVDAIIYRGRIERGDTIAVVAPDGVRTTRIRALLKPRAMDEIRDPRERFDSVKTVTAAAGIKISAPNLDGIIAGSPLYVVSSETKAQFMEMLEESREMSIETSEEGILVRADAIGSIEGIAFEAKEAEIPIRHAAVRDINKRDIIEAASQENPLYRAIFAFNVSILPDAKELLKEHDVKVIEGNIIYKLIEDYLEWAEAKKNAVDKDVRSEMVFPGKVLFMPDHTFRINKPAIVGMRVLAGRIRTGQRLIRKDGRVVGRIKSIRSGEESVKEAVQGSEVAVAVEGATVGRQMSEGDELYVDIPGGDVKKFTEGNYLNTDEMQVLEELKGIKRKEDKFWGM